MTQENLKATSNDNLSLMQVMMPKDTNFYGSIFGGFIMSIIDQAAYVEARRHGNKHRWVTRNVETIDFTTPVFVGDVITCYTKLVDRGTKHLTISVYVQSDRFKTQEKVAVTEASVVMVSVDPHGRAIPYDSPDTISFNA